MKPSVRATLAVLSIASFFITVHATPVLAA